MKQPISKLLILISIGSLMACQRQKALFQHSFLLVRALPERPSISTKTFAEGMIDSSDKSISASEVEFTASTANASTRSARPAKHLAQVASHFAASQQQADQVSTRQTQKVSLTQRLAMKYVESKIRKQLAPAKPQKFANFSLLYWIASIGILLLNFGANSPFLMVLGLIICTLTIVAFIMRTVRNAKRVT